jgi:hypothetical protein
MTPEVRVLAKREMGKVPKAQLLVSPSTRKGEPVRITGLMGEGAGELIEAVHAAYVEAPASGPISTLGSLYDKLEVKGYRVHASLFPFPDMFGLAPEDNLIEFTLEAK